jgi:hypothetical protein
MRWASNKELNEAARNWHGPYKRYDIVKEAVIALAVMSALALILTILLSSPDDRPSTIAQWSRQMPADFATTALSELDGTSATAEYGPPYNHEKESVQHIAFIHLQEWLGVSHPINTAHDYVIGPLRSIPGSPTLQRAVSIYQSAPAKTQTAWTEAYAKALEKASVTPSGSLKVAAGKYGPVPIMIGSLLALAQSGGLDGDLLTSRQFYQTDYTKPLLFMADGGLLAERAEGQHLLGTQWGIMNETGSYPGQVWLWLYTFWYQIEPFKSSHNADALVLAIMLLLSLALICVPFIPGIRDIPRAIPLYKLIWRDYYRSRGKAGDATPAQST